MKLAVRLVNNKLTEKDIELLKLEEQKRELRDRIKDDSELEQNEKQELFNRYKQLRKEIKDIAYNSAGLFNDAEFGHLLKGNKLNLELLNKWREIEMGEMAAGELLNELNELLKVKEYLIFTGVYLEGLKQVEVADKIDLSTSYTSSLMSKAKKKIEDKYNLEKVIEKLEQAEIDEVGIESIEDKLSDNDESEETTEKEIEVDDQEESTEEADQEAAEELLITLESDLSGEDIEQVSELMLMIQGVESVTTAEDKVNIDKVQKEVMATFQNLKEVTN